MSPGAAPADVAPAWETLRTDLVRFVQARVRDRALADDIVHDVLVKALAQLDGLREPARLRPWLYRITRNTIVDHFRSRRPAEPLPEEVAAADPEVERRAEAELARCLMPFLATLPPRYRRAVELADVEGRPQAEIALREGLSVSGAKSRVQRGRRMLRDAVLACCRVEVDRRGGVLTSEPLGECSDCG